MCFEPEAKEIKTLSLAGLTDVRSRMQYSQLALDGAAGDSVNI